MYYLLKIFLLSICLSVDLYSWDGLGLGIIIIKQECIFCGSSACFVRISVVLSVFCAYVFQLRNLTMEGCCYRSVHQDLINDLLRLSTSRYSQVWQGLIHKHTYVFTHKSNECTINKSLFYLRWGVKLRTCCSQHWEPTAYAAETSSLRCWSIWTQTALTSPSSNSK